MPSLRRTFSSPSVRSSPYPSAFSNSTNVGSGRVNGHGNRRSSGSETSGRRVLADLEWWRVVDGQHDGEVEHETEERDQEPGPDDGAPSGDHPNLVGEVVLERPATPVTWTFESPADAESPTGLPMSQFAALSIAPRTPPRLTRRHTHGVASTSSSLESTPEAVERPLECLRFGILDSDMGFSDAGVSPTLPTFRLACPCPSPPFLTTRAHSFDFSSLLNDSAGRFADIGVPSRDLDIFS